MSQTAPKGYWIAHNDVKDPDIYKQYLAANARAFEKFGGKFIVRGGRHETPQGHLRSRHVVVEFRDYETALACYHSPEYQEAAKIRLMASEGDLVIVEGPPV
ncbi:MAG: DUF1330 domain-containing protein [Alphaproteobacteria bacterium]|nr:DUF1330 domain-containing protein [Alphaproteobacteria bacterium]